jgi:hypothetical protein
MDAWHLQVMAGPFRTSCRVQHSFPVKGTAQTFVIAQLPGEFALCNALGWRWRQVCSGQQRVIRRFCLQNKPHPSSKGMKRLASGSKKRFCLHNKRFHPPDDESFIRNYFQMDGSDVELEADADNEAWKAGVREEEEIAKKTKDSETDIDSASEFSDDDDEVVQEFPASATVQDVWDATQCKDKEWEVRRAAYVRGLNGPAFIPTWQLPAPIADASSVWHATSVLAGEADTDNTADDAEDWEAFADMEADDIMNIVGNSHSKTSSEQGQQLDEWEIVDARRGRVSAGLGASALQATARTCRRDEPVVQQRVAKPQQKSSHQNGKRVVAKKAVDGQPKTVAEFRFQGKFKYRELRYERQRGTSQNYGFIEVNPKHVQAFREHPAWTPELAEDVFWHRKDCNSKSFGDDGQRAGDIVTFSVVLKQEGAVLQAQNVELKQRATWWHSKS